MPSASVIGAALERLASLALPAGTTVWFDEAPMRVGDTPVVPPYVVLQDDGTDVTVTVEGLPYEVTRLRLEIYGGTLAEADTIALAVKYNGQPVAQATGMDNAASLPLTGQEFKGMVRKREQRFQETNRSGEGLPVFRVRMEYAAAASRPA